jgi:hypothetical protein
MGAYSHLGILKPTSKSADGIGLATYATVSHAEPAQII